jgi:aldehyde oxidoreductase
MLKRTFYVNGAETRVVADPEAPLFKVLRNQLFLRGVKECRGEDKCGACTVILDGCAVKSCSVKMKDVPADAKITTIEGIGTKFALHPLQFAWIASGELGPYSSGLILTAKALLDKKANPSKDDAVKWFADAGLTCKDAEINAVLDGAKLLSNESTKEEIWLKAKGEPYETGSELAYADMATGASESGADLGLNLPEGTLHIKLVYPQALNADIYSIDTSEAEKMPGVYKVITSKDISGSNRVSPSRKILCDRIAGHNDDCAAAVVAYTGSAALNAAQKIKIKLAEGRGTAREADAQGHVTGFAYENDKGKLVIYSQRDNIDTAALAEGIGVQRQKISTVKIQAPGASAPAIEGILGVAALLTKKPVYLEL